MVKRKELNKQNGTKERQKSKSERQPQSLEPLEDKLIVSREEKVKALIDKIGGKWRALGEELYKIYKEDKEEAFAVISEINKKRGRYKYMKFENEQLKQWLGILLDILEEEEFNFPIDDEERAKTVLGLAALSGLKKEIKGEKDVKRGFAVTVIALTWDAFFPPKPDYERAAKLTEKLNLIEDLLEELVEIMKRWEMRNFSSFYIRKKFVNEMLSRWARELKKQGSNALKVAEKKRKGWSEEIKKDIKKWLAKSITWKYAISLIKAFGLQEEYWYDLNTLLLKHGETEAGYVLEEWAKELREKDDSLLEEFEKRTMGISNWIGLSNWIVEQIKKSFYDKSSNRRASAAIATKVFDLQERFLPELVLTSYDEDLNAMDAAREALAAYERTAGKTGKEIYGEVLSDQEKHRIEELIVKAVLSEDVLRSENALFIIKHLELQKEFLDMLVKLALDEDKYVSATAAEILGEWNEELEKKGSSVMAELEKKRKGWAEEVKEKIRVGVRSGRREAAVKLIGGLGLQEEYKIEMIFLSFDDNGGVRGAAEDAWERAGFGDVKVFYDEMRKGEKEQVKELIREAMRNNYSKRRHAAIELIEALGLQEEFKAELMLLMFDGDKDVRKIAKSVWKKASLGYVRRVYEKMSEKNKDRVKELIREAARSYCRDRWYAAAKLISKLGLEDELLRILIKFVLDDAKKVRSVGGKALSSWAKRNRKGVGEEAVKMKEDKALLPNPFALNEAEKLRDKLVLGMALLCS